MTELCGYSRTQHALAFHHVSDKSFWLPLRMFQFRLKKLLPELKKCVVVCHNCHTEIHDGLVDKEVVAGLRAANADRLQRLLAGKSWDHGGLGFGDLEL